MEGKEEEEELPPLYGTAGHDDPADGEPSQRHRILMVSDFFYPNFGGVENHIYQLSQCLLCRGHKVVVMTHAYGDVTGVRYLTNGLKVYYVPRLPFLQQSTFPTLLGATRLLRSVLVRERITLLHGHQAFSTLALEACLNARGMGLKVVFTDHSLFGFADAASILTNKVLKCVLADVHAVVCVSHTSKENTVLRACLPPAAVYVIPNAVDASQFQPDPRVAWPRGAAPRPSSGPPPAAAPPPPPAPAPCSPRTAAAAGPADAAAAPEACPPAIGTAAKDGALPPPAGKAQAGAQARSSSNSSAGRRRAALRGQLGAVDLDVACGAGAGAGAGREGAAGGPPCPGGDRLEASGHQGRGAGAAAASGSAAAGGGGDASVTSRGTGQSGGGAVPGGGGAHVSGAGIVLVVLCRLTYRKGADLLGLALPHLCARHPGLRVLIGGDGPKRALLQKVVSDHGLGDRVSLEGAVPHERARDFMVRGHVFVNASLTEAFCMALAEAAAAGLVVVSTAVGGVPEVLPPDMIELAEPSAEGLLAGIERALARVPAQQPRAQHERVRRMYNWNDVARRTERVYDAVAASTRDDTMAARLRRYAACGRWAGSLFCALAVLTTLYLAFLAWWAPARGMDVAPDWPRPPQRGRRLADRPAAARQQQGEKEEEWEPEAAHSRRGGRPAAAAARRRQRERDVLRPAGRPAGPQQQNGEEWEEESKRRGARE